MCGIFGYISKTQSGDRGRADKTINRLFKMSETRGKEASGLILLDSSNIKFIKDAIPASKLIKRNDFKKIVTSTLKKNENVAIFGHSRLVTNGESSFNKNNQPVFVNGVIGVHNGIITNDKELWKRNKDLNQETDLDTEVLFKVLAKNIGKQTLTNAIKNSFQDLEGVANIALMFENLNIAVLASNNGSLYYLKSNSNDSIIFASEKFILQQCVKRCKLSDWYSIENIGHISPNTFLTVDLVNLKTCSVGFDKSKSLSFKIEEKSRVVSDKSLNIDNYFSKPNASEVVDFSSFNLIYEANKKKISQLTRCTCCILPSTMPYISFNDKGVCNYCENYKQQRPKGINELKKILPRTGSDFDCLVTLSGGRDSSYGLHVISRVLGLKPVTYTYDWGMVTDLARRNQMRMCGKLGNEHILVSADLQKKRSNIRKNLLAWLKMPELGMIPLFMAGDKQYFYWSNKIAEQTNVKNIIFCENLLETTKFKSGFCGIKPIHGTANTYTLSIKNKFQMLYYYGKNFLKNPSYINSSIKDTISAFTSYYVINHNFINLFDYIEWDEHVINSTLIDGYKWEKSNDTDSTWRIGDGTAAFYNYIYFTMAGITENDTFRSNQVREGQINRKEALELSSKENQPRFESIKWYLDVLDLDFKSTVNIINAAKKLY